MRRSALPLLLLTGVGLALRARGLDWGLPWALHIDERLFVVAKAIQLERTLAGVGVPDPGISSYGILPLWTLVLARKLLLGTVTQPGPPTWGDGFAGTVLLARWISVLWGVATILFVARWGLSWGRITSFVGAGLVAGFPALVQASHFGTVEAPLVALLAGGMVVAERLARSPSLPWSLAGGVVLGLAISVKAPGAVLLLPLLHAAYSAGSRRFPVRAGSLVLVAAIVVVALNPSILTGGAADRTGEHVTLSGNLARAYSADFRDWTLPYANDVPVWTELTRLLPYAIGILPELLALAGLVWMARRRSGADVRLLLLVVPLLLVLFPARVKTVRFLLPALPALAIAAAELVRVLAEARPRVRRVIVPATLVLALLHGLAFSSIYADTDSRVAAARWLDENAGPRDLVVVEDPPGYGPPIGSPNGSPSRPSHRYEILWRGFYAIHEKLDEAGRREHIERVLRRADFLALSEGHRAEFTTSDLRPVEKRFYDDLDAGALPFEKVAEFKVYPRLGPFELRDDGAEILMRIFDHPRIEIWKRVAE